MTRPAMSSMSISATYGKSLIMILSKKYVGWAIDRVRKGRQFLGKHFAVYSVFKVATLFP